MKHLKTFNKMVDVVLAYKYKPKKKSGKKKKAKKQRYSCQSTRV